MVEKKSTKLTPAIPTVVEPDWHISGQGEIANFDTKGDTCRGVLLSSFSYKDNFENNRTGYRVRTDDGLVIVFERGDLARKMQEVPEGSMVKITYKGMIKTKKGNNMHNFEVKYQIKG
jgi:hypothetical protein